MSVYGYCNQNPVNLIDPSGMAPTDWYKNKSTGDYEFFSGSSEIDGYKHLGANYDIQVSNDQTGEYAGTMHLLENGDARYVQTNTDGSNPQITEISNQTYDPGWTFGHKIKSGDWGLRTLSDAWNSPLARYLVPDIQSVGLSSNVSAFLGCGSTPINFTFISRGDIGLYFTPTVNGAIGTGIEANAGVAFSKGWYTGDPRQIQSSFLQGHSIGASVGLGVLGDASVGVSYAPADINNLRSGGFINVEGQIGIGIEGSPATVVNGQINYQYTPIVKPIFQFR